jgi:DNA-binding CsgD family transcriptional regulator/dipeptidyl aminopeptidase/acylaminoacyl peptidase
MSRRGRPRHPDILTPREWEVLGLLREGLSNPEIAARLGISRAGAKYHVAEILGKLGLENRDAAAQWRPTAAARPWWAAAAAPIGMVRRLPGWASAALGGGALLGAAGGLALLAVLLLRTDGDGRFAIGADVSWPVTPTVALGEQAIFALDVRTGELERLPVPVPSQADLPGVAPEMSADGSMFAYLGDGRVLLYDREGNERALDTSNAGGVMLDWSDDGAKILFGGSDGLKTLDVESGAVGMPLAGDAQDAAFSPDGTRIALVSRQRLVVLDVPGLGSRGIAGGLQATYLPNAYGPGHLAWSPDGERIAFAEWRVEEPITQGQSDLYVVNADGTGLRRLTDSPRAKLNYSWSPDGARVAYVRSTNEGDVVEVVDVESGVVTPAGVRLNVSRPSPWVSADELLAGGYDGIALAGLRGAPRRLVATTRECSHRLLGRVDNVIYFLTACSEPGL